MIQPEIGKLVSPLRRRRCGFRPFQLFLHTTADMADSG